MKSARFSMLLPALFFAASNVAQAASFTIFTDEAAFTSALASFTTEDFDDFFVTNGQTFLGTSSPTQFSGFSVEQSSAAGGNQFSAQVTDAAGDYEINAGSQSPYLQLRGEGDPIFTFDRAVVGFGATFNSVSPNSDMTLTVLGQSFLLENYLTSPPPAFPGAPDADQFGGFFGFISDTALTSLTLGSTSGQPADTFAMDGVQFAPIPAPLPAVLLASGIVALVGSSKRSRRT